MMHESLHRASLFFRYTVVFGRTTTVKENGIIPRPRFSDTTDRGRPLWLRMPRDALNLRTRKKGWSQYQFSHHLKVYVPIEHLENLKPWWFQHIPIRIANTCQLFNTNSQLFDGLKPRWSQSSNQPTPIGKQCLLGRWLGQGWLIYRNTCRPSLELL